MTQVTSGSSPHTRGARFPARKAPEPRWDHPRIRGEHGPDGRAEPRGEGIIPAYAGSTVSDCSMRNVTRGSSPHTRGAPSPVGAPVSRPEDHPRIRGEHDGLTRAIVVPVGIIPAYAGSTYRLVSPPSSASGSSPHTRGAHLSSCKNRRHTCITQSLSVQLSARPAPTITRNDGPFDTCSPYSSLSSEYRTGSHHRCPQSA